MKCSRPARAGAVNHWRLSNAPDREKESCYSRKHRGAVRGCQEVKSSPWVIDTLKSAQEVA